MSIHWYPGHMHKATKEIKEILPKMDVVIEVLDARIPYSSSNPVIAEFCKHKPCIKVLTKTDLADPAVTQQWVAHFEQQQQTKALAVNIHQPDRILTIMSLCHKLVPEKQHSVSDINALITGISNVGKSTIINILAGRTIAKTGNTPGVTKSQQRIQLDNGIVLFDTPGILWPKVENENSSYRLAATGAINNTAFSYDDVAFFVAEYLLTAYPDVLKQRFELTDLPSSELALLETIGQKRGCLGRGGRVDLNRISEILINELRTATLGLISLESPTLAMQEHQIVMQRLQQKAAEKAAKKQARKQAFKQKNKS